MQKPLQPAVVDAGQLGARNDVGAAAHEPDAVRDGLGRRGRVAGHHEHPDARCVRAGDGSGDLRARRVEHPDQPEELEVALDRLDVERQIVRQRSPREREHAQGAALHRFCRLARPAPVVGRELGEP